MKMRVLCIALFVAVTLCPCVLSVNDVYVLNNKLFVDNKEFIVKGVDYSPSPIGRKTMNGGTGYGGTGFCSAKLTPWGEYKSACYDSDYFDGSPDIDPTRFPTGFKPLWDRDFPRIKEEGANTIRLYNCNPSTRAATKTYTNLYPYATGKDHTQFMDLCAQYGFKVIFPLYSDNTAFLNTDETTYKRFLRFQMDEVGNHSALLVFQLGNEMGWSWPTSGNTQWNDANIMAKYNRYANYIRRYMKSRFNRFIPVTIATVNIESGFNYQTKNFHVDIFSSNVFGDTFSNLFPGDGTANYLGINKLACMYNKPFLMTEFYRTYKCCEAYPKNDFNLIWKNVVDAIAKYGMLGAVYFEQTDEPALNKDFGAFALAVGYNGTQNSTTTDVILADAIVAKQQYYDIVSGTYSSKPYNMKTDIFSLLGRLPVLFNQSLTDPCKLVGTYKACPGVGLPVCSGNGACDRTTGTCSCSTGWSGTDCSKPVCTSNCNSRGSCSGLVAPPECICSSGYYGATCQSTVSSVPAGQCPGACSGNGLCNTTSSACTCWPGWAGADCATHTFVY